MSKGRTHDSCRTIGAELLASGWMMRLWTLHEAFVSDQLRIALCDHGDFGRAPPSLNNLWGEGEEGERQGVLVSSMTEMMRQKVNQNLMKVDSLVPVARQSNTERALLIASAWKAVRYRTTRNPGEETLALSSLLDIPISQDDNTIQDDRERLMERFWATIGKDPIFGSSIPPGIIFLPGKRLPSAGFRWAPATWMSGEVEAYPFPLDNPRYPTELTDQGLIVHYPGFLLHPDNEKLKDIISEHKRNTFEFSVGRGLDEWYKVASAKKRGLQNDVSLPTLDNSNRDPKHITLDLRNRLGSNPPLKIGIILSRPRPVEVQGETGLLVEIYDEKTLPPKAGRPVSQDSLFYCRIIRRVEVTRLSMGSLEGPLHPTRNEERLGNGSILSRYEKFVREVAGVQLDEAQGWCVDGFASKPPPPLPRRQTETPPHTQDGGIMNRIRRVWTGSSRLESADQ
ncbi:hypothetical protein NW752_004407 [Fusarium irregulare]|uniref:Heterokaryon incompatibility domain-containing protein n=1 Tax=Fusarium irregulare TaxID=2494466 RepID=A0A9W8PN03_9HYPO|nr:hypothetical protein NW766_007313 [Fusarium irregulare]KAJ4021399.1 hypothetical protein NW752_004407 [Fusarium irregulare]